MSANRADPLERPPRRIAVFRALQLGDVLCIVPALRSLRAAWPDSELTLIGLPWAQAFTRRFDRYLDRFIAFPGHPRMPEQVARPSDWAPFLETVRARNFDLVLQMHGSGTLTNRLVADLGSRTAGFHPAGSPPPDPSSYVVWCEEEHEIKRYLRLLRHLGIPALGDHLEWPRKPADDAVDPVLSRLRARGPYVVMHPGARLPSRRWPIRRFAAVADRLAAREMAIVITGSAEEVALGAAMAQAMRSSALNLVGRTDLGGVAAIVAGAALVICNDTGMSHIAAAVGTPSVVVCCGADPRRWAPLDTCRHTVLFHAIACRPCMHTVCPIGHPCATALSTEAVCEHAVAALVRPGLRDLPAEVA